MVSPQPYITATLAIHILTIALRDLFILQNVEGNICYLYWIFVAMSNLKEISVSLNASSHTIRLVIL